MNRGSTDSAMNDRPGRPSFLWTSLVTFLVLSVLVLGFMGTFSAQVLGTPAGRRVTGSLNPLTSHMILVFVICPFLLRLPKGSRSFSGYLGDIGRAKR